MDKKIHVTLLPMNETLEPKSVWMMYTRPKRRRRRRRGYASGVTRGGPIKSLRTFAL